MNDETLMAEKIGSLEQENRQLERDKASLRDRIHKLERQLEYKKFGRRLSAFIFTTGLVVGLGWLSWKAVNSYTTDTCYIDRSEERIDVFRVKRVVEWGQDMELGYSTDLDKAMEIAKKQGCRAPRVEGP